jgi:DUF971 family protein
MPPGTGDIQLTLSQIMNISAAVVVTTPQRLSFVDVVKGIDMFDTVNVPCIAVVENMAQVTSYSFDDKFYDDLSSVLLTMKDKENVKQALQSSITSRKMQLRLFGAGHSQRLKDMWGIDNIVSLPLLEEVSQCGDSGKPYVLSYPDSETSKAFVDLAAGIIAETDLLAKSGKYNTPTIAYDETSGNVLIDGQKKIKAFDLRCNCKCAVCVEEMTGKKLLNDNMVPRTVSPRGFSPIGRYALSVDWSDGHKSLYPYRQLDLLSQR